jgi:hypothetical protein
MPRRKRFVKPSPSTFADAQVMKPSGKRLFFLKKELTNSIKIVCPIKLHFMGQTIFYSYIRKREYF